MKISRLANKRYFNTMEMDERPVSTFVKDAMELRKGLTTTDGRPIPCNAEQVTHLDHLLFETMDA